MFVLETADDRGIEPHRAGIQRALAEGWKLLRARLPALTPRTPTGARPPKLPRPTSSRSPLTPRGVAGTGKQVVKEGGRVMVVPAAPARHQPSIRELRIEEVRKRPPLALDVAPAPDLTPLYSLPAGADASLVGQFRQFGLHRFFVLKLPIDHIELEAVLGDQKRARLFEVKALLRQHTQLASIAVDLPVEGLAGSGTTRPSTAATAGWHLTAIGVDAANRAGITGAGVRIAHPDTGWTRHPELPLACLDLDHQFNVFNPLLSAEEPLEDAWKTGQIGTFHSHHGTATGSVIVSTDVAATGTGDVLGVAPGARIIPIRCASAVLLLSGVSLSIAILRAVFARADVISMSLGGLGGKHLQAVLKLAVARNIIPVAAAGNMFPLVVCPALYAETIGVAAIADTRQPMSSANASFASASGCAVDIAAPGASILRAHWNEEAPWKALRSASDGTSYATAATAGAAALWLQKHGRQHLISGLRTGETLLDVFRGHLKRSASVPEIWDGQRMGAGVLHVPGLLDPAVLAAYRAEPWLPTPINAAVLALPMTWQAAIVKMLCPLFGLGAVKELLERLFVRGLAAVEELGEELVAFLRESAEVAEALVEAVRVHVRRFIDGAIAKLTALLASAAAAAKVALQKAIEMLTMAKARIDAAVGDWVESVEDVVSEVLRNVNDLAQDAKQAIEALAREAKEIAETMVEALGDVAEDAIDTISAPMRRGLRAIAGLFD